MLYNRESEWNSRAPSYAYESDSSDDEWTDTIKSEQNLSTNQPGTSNRLNKKTHEEITLEWKPDIPKPMETGKPVLILIGSITKPILQTLKLNQSTFISLNYKQKPYVYLDTKNSIIYFPNKTLINLNLQTQLSKETITKLNPTGKIIIISSYEISNYITLNNHKETSRIKYLCSNNQEEAEHFSLEKFSIPNIIQGIDASIFLQAEINQSKPILYLLPNQSETVTELYETNSIQNSTNQQIKETQTALEHIIKTMGFEYNSKEEDSEFDWNLFDHLKPNLVKNDDYMKSMYV